MTHAQNFAPDATLPSPVTAPVVQPSFLERTLGVAQTAFANTLDFLGDRAQAVGNFVEGKSLPLAVSVGSIATGGAIGAAVADAHPDTLARKTPIDYTKQCQQTAATYGSGRSGTIPNVVVVRRIFTGQQAPNGLEIVDYNISLRQPAHRTPATYCGDKIQGIDHDGNKIKVPITALTHVSKTGGDYIDSTGRFNGLLVSAKMGQRIKTTPRKR